MLWKSKAAQQHLPAGIFSPRRIESQRKSILSLATQRFGKSSSQVRSQVSYEQTKQVLENIPVHSLSPDPDSDETNDIL